jgi:hypothetical protein
MAGEVGAEHCDELRSGASGPNPLFIEFRYTDEYGGYEDGWKDYYCRGVPRM